MSLYFLDETLQVALVGWWRWNAAKEVSSSYFIKSNFFSTIWWCSRVLVLPTYFYKMCIYESTSSICCEHLVDVIYYLNFISKKKYKKIRTHVAKNWSFYYDTKYVQSFFLDRFGISWFLSWQWGKQKRISLLLCRS